MASFLASVRGFLKDTITNTRGPFGKLVQQAMADPELRSRFVENPKEVLAENGVALPEAIEVEVLENTESVVHVVLPPMVDTS